MEDTAKRRGKRIHYPWVTFTLNGGHFCISSKYVSSMVLNNEFQPLPDSAPGFIGMMSLIGNVIPVFDARTLLDLPPMLEMIDHFEQLREEYGQWTEALAVCMQTGEPFLLGTNAAQSSFGIWLSGYQTDNHSIKFVLNKLGALHEQFYAVAAAYEPGEAGQDRTTALLEELHEYTAQLSRLFDQLIEAYTEAHKGTVIVLDYGEKTMGLLVDQISGVQHFTSVTDQSAPGVFGETPFVTRVITNNGTNYLQMDVSMLAMPGQL